LIWPRGARVLDAFRRARPWLFVGLATVLGLIWGVWPWQTVLMSGLWIAAFLVVVRGLANEAIQRWATTWRPHSPGPIVPRVWDFLWRPSRRFMAELERIPRRTDLEVVAALFKMGATTDALTKLRIEEWTTRVRVHRWRAPANEEAGTAPETYRWDDFRIDDLRAKLRNSLFESDTLSRARLWSYATESMACTLNLSLGYQDAKDEAPSHLQLILWLDRGKPVATDDVLLTVPLEPVMLNAISDGFYGWSGKSGDGDSFRWEWGLGVSRF
jgi:hypothetical protein